MIAASTMVPVLVLNPRACNAAPTLANSDSPSLLSLSSRQNFNFVVASGTGSRSRIDAYEAAQADAVVQCVLTGQVRQIKPVLNEVDAQHALQTDR
tara:strand:- start:274 stop:561 length:288 start_codon:yes stop_codon:yes gene_type:complete